MFMMPQLRNSISILSALLVVSSCAEKNQCTAKSAVVVAVQHASKTSNDIGAYNKKYRLKGNYFLIELSNPNAGTGGRYLYEVDKTNCKITNWLGEQ